MVSWVAAEPSLPRTQKTRDVSHGILAGVLRGEGVLALLSRRRRQDVSHVVGEGRPELREGTKEFHLKNVECL